jgi:Flp pilus assembly protein TadG
MPIRSFLKNCHGGVAPMFALALVPLIAAVGSSVDYTIAAKVRSQLLAAADSASIGSVSKTSAGLAAAALMTADGTVTAGVTDATKLFNAHVGSSASYTLNSVTAKVVKSGLKITSTVEFAADVPMHFMGFFGHKVMTVKGSATAANSIPPFIDFYLLLDNTPSMGVAATPADVTTMVNGTSDKCAFACHNTSDSNNYYKLAKQLGVTMRIDVLRNATQKLMDTAKATAVFSNQFRMGIYTFGADATKVGLTTIQSPTTNLANAKSAAASIDLMTIPYQNYRGDTQTNLVEALGDIESKIAKPGDGSSSSKPQKFLFFVSDGVANRVNGSPGCTEALVTSTDPQTGVKYARCQEPLNVSECDAIKKRGIKIAVLYTTYLPLPTNDWYNDWISPFSSKIGKNMESCASPDLYFEVSPSQGISEAMTALFQKAVAQARLTK